MPLLLKPGFYQARNSIDPNLLTFHKIEHDLDGSVWVHDCPNPQSPLPTLKRKRRPSPEFLAKLQPLAGGINDKSMMEGSTAAVLTERTSKELSNEGVFIQKSADAVEEYEDKLEHFVRTIGDK